MSPSPNRVLLCLALTVLPTGIAAQNAMPPEMGDGGAAAATVASIVDDILAGHDGAPAWDALSTALGDSPAAIPAAWFASRAAPDAALLSIEAGAARDRAGVEESTGIGRRVSAALSRIPRDDPRMLWIGVLLVLVVVVIVGVPLLRKALRAQPGFRFDSPLRSPRARRRRARRRVGKGSACRDAEQLRARIASTRAA